MLKFVRKHLRIGEGDHGERFEIQIAGERISVPARTIGSIEHDRKGASQEIEFQIKWENPQ